MNNEYWHQKWQAKEIGFNQSQPNKLMQRYFSSLELKSGSRVFVPLCGQSIDMLWLASQGYHVVGVELSQVACCAFFKEHKIPVTIVEMNDFISYESDDITIYAGDFFKLDRKIPGKIDAVYDRAALVALPEATRKAYSKHLIKLMPRATAMFLITTSYNQNEMQGPPFSVDEMAVNELYSAHFVINQLYSKQFDVPSHLRLKACLKLLSKRIY
ncbi:MAG: thiopurine S-methyltransferase [Legionella sp.]|nr:thiopurine S-methyltransferase [Legionella sp.]